MFPERSLLEESPLSADTKSTLRDITLFITLVLGIAALMIISITG